MTGRTRWLSLPCRRCHSAWTTSRQAPTQHSSRSEVSRELPPAIPLPSLLDMADLAPTTAELVLTLNRLGTRRGEPILASMYRHLAHWPAYLALALGDDRPARRRRVARAGDRQCRGEGAGARRARRNATVRPYRAGLASDPRHDTIRGRAVHRRRHCQDDRHLRRTARGHWPSMSVSFQRDCEI